MEQLVDRPLADARELKDELDLLRHQVARLESEVGGLARRLEGLETARRATASGGEAPPAGVAADRLPAEAAADPMPAPLPRATAIPTELTHVGRLLLVLAGGFLLRAATEGGQLPAPLGIAIGLLYALAWLPAAHRAGRRGDGGGAAFHALATLLIAYPLLFEAAHRFHVLGAGPSALALAGVTALLLHAGWRQRSPAVAWLALPATVATAAALALETGAPATFAALLVGFAGAALALGEQRGWRPLGAVSAAVAAGAVGVLTLATLMPHPLPPAAVLPVQLSLLLLYLGFTAGIVGRGHVPGWSLRLQCTGALVVGWGGALVSARVAGGDWPLVVGLLGVALAAAAEALALRRLAAASAPLQRLFLGAATALFLGGTTLLLARPAGAWMTLAVAAVWLGARGHPGLQLQGVLLATAAVVTSGAFAAATAGLLRPTVAPPAWSVLALFAVGALAACLPPLATAAPRSLARDVAAALVLAVLTWTGVGALVAAVSRQPSVAGVAAAAGTLLLAASAALLAQVGHGGALPAAAWLVYPLLVATTFKLLLVDLPNGHPLSLFVSFAALGCSLLVAARAARRSTSGVAAPAPGA